MNIFDTLLVHPFLNLLVLFYQLLVSIHVPYAVGFSIILLTVFTRILLFPFMQQSLKQQKKMQEMTPEINKLKEKYKADPRKLQMEQMALFKAKGVNPASGCFLLLLQLPILIGLYNVLLKVVNLKSPNDINSMLYTESLKLNHMWDTSFFGLPLGQTPAQLLPSVGVGIFLVAVITGVTQFIQSKMMTPTSAEKDKLPKKKEPDFATVFQTQTLYLLPIFVGFFAHTLPFGLSLYWNTLTIFGIIQQYTVAGWGGLADWLPGQKEKKVSKFK
ncbi:MAG: YidC/Oxa1 family membrane protein insertase [Candidatus Levybacteria bacterium]|nr:YidC/Oxa1 family membrane protein insertase [Candidatus Levybacteria bacterium]